MATNIDLEHISELADARLGVAENFAWPVAALGFACVYLKWDSIALALLAAVVAFAASIIPFRRAAALAEDAFFQQAQLGKYSKAGGGGDA